jgi:hypothetical protein
MIYIDSDLYKKDFEKIDLKDGKKLHLYMIMFLKQCANISF